VVPSAGMQSAFELPAIALLGLATGALAGVFTRACALFAVHFFTFRPLVAFLVTGTVTGVLAQAVPQIMGVGHDILEAMLTRELAAPLLLGIVSCKILATSVAVGCRLPGGLIGPSLVIGGAMGSLLHFMLGGILHEGMASPGFYAIIGMAAMMGATLQAPLAALIALLELTGMPGIILPGMLAMVAADAVCRLFMGRESVFVALLRAFRSTADRDAGRLV
jgi:CIC family chloride channel protein